jgi:hypothetical protein
VFPGTKALLPEYYEDMWFAAFGLCIFCLMDIYTMDRGPLIEGMSSS